MSNNASASVRKQKERKLNRLPVPLRCGVLVVASIALSSWWGFYALRQHSTTTIDDELLLSKQRYVANIGTKECLDTLRNENLLSENEMKEAGVLLCSPSNTALLNLVRSTRLRVKEMERIDYLRSLRSYRLSGLVCNDHLDPSVPKAASEVAFKCLPLDYRRRACMEGRAGFPKACSAFRRPETSAQDELRMHGPYMAQKPSANCDTPGINCSSSFMGLQPPIDSGQLPSGIANAKILKIRSDKTPLWTPPVLDYITDMIHQGQDISPGHYPGAHAALEKALLTVGARSKTALVLGSISPWVEALAIHLGATTITVDYHPPLSTDSRLEVKQMDEMLRSFETYPLIVSYSSLEHDGQGRYGDPLDPDGDLAAMKEAWLKLANGGYFLLGVPFDSGDSFFWFSMRTYGPARLPVLTQGWEYAGLATDEKLYNPNETFSLTNYKWEDPAVLILRKPNAAKVFLDDNTLAEGESSLKCNHLGECGGAVQEARL